MCACSVHLYLYAELVYMRVMHGIPYAIEYRCSFTIHSMGIEHFWMVLSHSHLAMAPVWMCEFECTVYALCSIQFCFIKRNSCCMYTRYRYVYLRCTHTTKKNIFQWELEPFLFWARKKWRQKEWSENNYCALLWFAPIQLYKGCLWSYVLLLIRSVFC